METTDNEEKNINPDQKGSAELSPADYLSKKKEEYFAASGASEEGWKAMRSQIISGVYLKLPWRLIDLYTDAGLGYEQREVIKLYLYINKDITEDIIKEALSYPAPEMFDFFQGRKSPEKIISDAEKRLVELNESISAYRKDYQDLLTRLEGEISELKEKLSKNEAKLAERNEKIKKLTEEYNKLVDETNKRIADEAGQKEFDWRVREEAKRLVEKEGLLGEFTKTPSVNTQKEPRIFNIKHKVRKNKGSIKPYTEDILPENFDITSYIINAGISTDQMKILALAVRHNIDDRLLKRLIDDDVPAQQMKQLISIELIKKDNQKFVAADEGEIYYRRIDEDSD